MHCYIVWFIKIKAIRQNGITVIHITYIVYYKVILLCLTGFHIFIIYLNMRCSDLIMFPELLRRKFTSMNNGINVLDKSFLQFKSRVKNLEVISCMVGYSRYDLNNQILFRKCIHY